MRVIIDTNIIRAAGFRFSNPSMEALLLAQRAGVIQLLIPAVVVEETTNLHSRQLDELISEMKGRSDRFNAIAGVDFIKLPNDAELDQMKSNYESDLRSGTNLESTRILPFPGVLIEDATKAAVRKNKPFAEKGTGFRDYLIWQTVLEELGNSDSDDTIIFVSTNHQDFGDSESNGRNESPRRLHADLISDLDEAGYKEGDVVYRVSLDDLISNEIRPRLQPLQALAKQVQELSFPNPDLFEAIHSEIERWIDKNASERTYPLMGLPEDVTWIESVDISGISEVPFADVRRLPDGKSLLAMTVLADVTFEVSTDQNSPLGIDFSDATFVVGYHEVSGSIERQLRFGVSAIIGESPDYEFGTVDLFLLYDRPQLRRNAEG